MKQTLIVILLLCISSPAFSLHLKWDIKLNDRIEVVRTANVEHLKNNKVFRVYEERNIIDLTCVKKIYDNRKVKGEFNVYRRAYGEKVFKLKEHYESEFIIEPNGRYQIDNKYYMPNLRHIPTFPDKKVQRNSKWQATGELMVNDFSRRFKILFNVKYTLFDIEVKNGRRIAQIHYEYIINKDLNDKRYPPDFPLKIIGKSLGVIYWDIQKNQPIESKDRYKIAFIFRKGRRALSSYMLKMNIDTKNKIYSQVSKKQKEKDKEEIEKELPKDGGVSVDTNKKGIVLRMGDVLFDFDSYKMRDDTKKAVDNIIGIIKKKYPDREIIVEGHTDSIGSKKYNQKLSEKRAKTIAEYLKNGIDHDKLSYRGHGAEKPIASNKTKKGRKKNRRVEIIIKLN